jgi:hypothetical protein
MGEQIVPSPPIRGIFEKRWVRNIIIGGVIFVVVVIALETVLQTMSPMGGPGTIVEEDVRLWNKPSGVVNDSMSLNTSGGMQNNKSIGANNTMTEAVSPMALNNAENSTDKKVIKNGNLSLKVGSVDNSAKDIAAIAKNNDGDVFSSSVYNRNNIKSGNIVIRIPVANFEKTFNEIKKVASLVVRESTTGQDVTEEYTDLQAQLKNRQAEELQFQLILQQSQKIQDVLDVTQQLYRVRGEIEQLQGRIKYLASQTDMATITVSLSEDQGMAVSNSWRPWQVAKDAVNALIKKSQGFINFSIVLVVTVIPIAILYLILIYIIFLIARKIYRKIGSSK